MSFVNSLNKEVNKTLPDGTVIGTESVSLPVLYAVKTINITESSSEACLHCSYDSGGTWQIHGTYPVNFSSDSGVSFITQAEVQIRQRDEFSGSVSA
ncbi:TPA: hypothetical protein ACSIUJ_000150 [Klebsiella pneumoniae]